MSLVYLLGILIIIVSIGFCAYFIMLGVPVLLEAFIEMINAIKNFKEVLNDFFDKDED